MFKNFYQKDKKWKNFFIPGTNLTLGQAGCCVCCLSNILWTQNSVLTPLILAPKFKYTHGLIYWNSVDNLNLNVKFIKRINKPNKNEIDNWLKLNGLIVIKINITRNPKKMQEHWINLWQQIEQDNYLISDSLKTRVNTWQNLQIFDRTIFAGVFFKITKN